MIYVIMAEGENILEGVMELEQDAVLKISVFTSLVCGWVGGGGGVGWGWSHPRRDHAHQHRDVPPAG